MIKIPLASKEPTFKDWCAERKLQARGSGGFASKAEDDGIRDVSNVDRMGKDEVTLVNEMIQGIIDLIKWEKELEAKAAPAEAKGPMFPAGQGAKHGPWSDETFTTNFSSFSSLGQYFTSHFSPTLRCREWPPP